MTLDDLLGPYRFDNDEERRQPRHRRSSMVRNALPLSRFWSPSDALSRQPWFGFPGGREAWLEWRQTGQLPEQAGEGQSRRLTPEQTDFYYRLHPDTGQAPPGKTVGGVVPGVNTATAGDPGRDFQSPGQVGFSLPRPRNRR